MAGLYHTRVLLALMAVLYHTRVLLDLDGCSISYSCPLGLDDGWTFYIILVSSWTLMAGLYHTHVLLALMAVLYHTRVLLDLDGCSISYSCPLGH